MTKEPVPSLNNRMKTVLLRRTIIEHVMVLVAVYLRKNSHIFGIKGRPHHSSNYKLIDKTRVKRSKMKLNILTVSSLLIFILRYINVCFLLIGIVRFFFAR